MRCNCDHLTQSCALAETIRCCINCPRCQQSALHLDHLGKLFQALRTCTRHLTNLLPRRLRKPLRNLKWQAPPRKYAEHTLTEVSSPGSRNASLHARKLGPSPAGRGASYSSLLPRFSNAGVKKNTALELRTDQPKQPVIGSKAVPQKPQRSSAPQSAFKSFIASSQRSYAPVNEHSPPQFSNDLAVVVIDIFAGYNLQKIADIFRSISESLDTAVPQE